MYSRTRLLIKDKIDVLKNKHIAIFGIGGVGGYVCEMFARIGIGKLTIIDFDTIDISNINRQIIALHSTLGKKKVDVMCDRIVDINPNIVVNKIDKRFNEQTSDEIFKVKFDYVVDCIDSINDKLFLITKCKDLNIPLISAMGAGNRFDIPEFYVGDIFDTYNDGLAKIMRKKLRALNINNLKVVYSKTKACKVSVEEETIFKEQMMEENALYNNLSEENTSNKNTLNNNTSEETTSDKNTLYNNTPEETTLEENTALLNKKNTIGSISYYPAECGIKLSAYVINDIIGEKND